MAYFPIFTQIDGKRCLIAGGGKVAARKVYTLLQYGADVVVMAEKCVEKSKKFYLRKMFLKAFLNIFIKIDVIKMNGI